MEVIPGSGLNVGMLERFFESVGLKITTIKVIKPKEIKPVEHRHD